ncbi:MAG: fumarate hydratase [bacterium]|nr:fumarate hydratase [bacterium]
MREIEVKEITSAVAKMCIDANYFLPADVLSALKQGKEQEESPLGKEVFDQLIENARIAKEENYPICQDTGLAVIFVELGQEVHITKGNLIDAINAGVRQGYQEGYLRKSIVNHPFLRKNTGDNTPAIIHTFIVPGDKLKISIAPKGGGSENMSGLKMLKPSDGIEGVKIFVIDTVKSAGSNPCPPIIIGVGIGGNFEMSAILSKKALLRELGQHHPANDIAELETELLKLVNQTGVGPEGLGGRITALAVNIEIHPCHIASMPVAVNIQCHAARHQEIII